MDHGYKSQIVVYDPELQDLVKAFIEKRNTDMDQPLANIYAHEVLNALDVMILGVWDPDTLKMASLGIKTKATVNLRFSFPFEVKKSISIKKYLDRCLGVKNTYTNNGDVDTLYSMTGKTVKFRLLADEYRKGTVNFGSWRSHRHLKGTSRKKRS